MNIKFAEVRTIYIANQRRKLIHKVNEIEIENDNDFFRLQTLCTKILSII